MGRKPKEDRRQKVSKGIRKLHLFNIRTSTLEGIEYIEAKIHRMILSGDMKYRKTYNLKSLKVGLKNPYFNKNFDPEERGGTYRSKYFRRTKKFQLYLFTDPISGYYPPFMIEIHPIGYVDIKDLKKLLVGINNSNKNVLVSIVEYTIDQFCYTPDDVEALFRVERFSLYVPKQQGGVRPLGEDKISFDKDGRKTLSLEKPPIDEKHEIPDEEEGAEIEEIPWDHVNSNGGQKGSEKNGRKALIWNISEKDKMYERGDDKDKEGDTWDYEDFDRVRLEHTADWRELRNNGIKTVDDFIENPKFFEINNRVWNFRRFKETHSKERIKEWETNAAPFQELLKATKLKNPTQYTEDVEVLVSLKLKIIEAMKLYDDEWTKCVVR